MVIEVYDTRESTQLLVSVKETNEEKACKKVAKYLGYIWIGPASNDLHGFWALDEKMWKIWHKGARPGDMERDIEAAHSGKQEEFRGLMALYQSDIGIFEID